MFRKSYSTARDVLGFLIFVGWVSVSLGAILCFVVLSNAGNSRYGTDGIATLFAITPGIVLIVGGLTQVAFAQVGRAVLDQANISRANLAIMHKLATRVGIEPGESVDAPKADDPARQSPEMDDEPRDSLGFNVAGERIYRGQMIRRLNGRYYVGHREFSTLGQAKRHIDG